MHYAVKNTLVLAVVSLSLTGCAINTPTLYHWGEYENLIYSMYIEPGSADPTMQVEKLTTDIQRAADRGKNVAPGVYAHLGFMYALLGNVELSKAAFDEEKALFPESSVFIDGMMKRANKDKEIEHASI